MELGIPGRHNVLNALAAIALATELGVDFPSVTRGLAFAGAKRRFETKYLSPPSGSWTTTATIPRK